MEREQNEGLGQAHARRGVLLGIIVAGGAVVVIGGALWFMAAHSRASQLPGRIRESVSFPIYLPHPLPDGFQADMTHASYDQGAGLLHLLLTDHFGRTVSVNEQPVPNGFPADDLAAQGSPIDAVAIGQGILSTIPSGTVATIVSQDKRTLILLNTSSATKDELSDLAQSLRLSQ
ncbi:MAG TPA: hypothetical protein VLF71_02935 [Candidatus Saccharimonadales bacterium]|nr:hypothetical protein [Candidatus Saccharimonadales bacterium]